MWGKRAPASETSAAATLDLSAERAHESALETAREGAYETVSFGELWGVLSLALFVGSLSTRFLIRLLPFSLQGWNRLPPHVVTAVPILAALGILAALIGDRKESTMCRFGFVLNAIVLGLSGLLVAAFVVWRLGR